VLCEVLPDVETALFFGKLFDLDAYQLGAVLSIVSRSSVVDALLNHGDAHSADLQGYLVDIADMLGMDYGDVTFSPDVPKGEVLPELWESLQVEIATAIKDVAAKMESVIGLLPGKQGTMMMQSMMVMNAKRPVIGDYRARIHHEPVKENLVIFDVSGSMSEPTVRTIIDDVVAMSYQANAHMAVVSNTCSYWTPGSYSVDDVLERCEFSGTHYEELEELLNRDWGTVICVADYDSSTSAKQHLTGACVGHIDTVLDISLVNRPTFLAECVGQLADVVRPLLVGSGQYVLSS